MNENIQDSVAFFKEYGYVIFKNVYDETFVNEWAQHAGSLKTRSDRWIFGGLLEIAPQLSFKLLTNKLILNFAESIMGPFVQLDGLTLVGFPPITQQEAQKRGLHWHRDPWGHVPFGHAFEYPLAINALTYLQNLDEKIGPLRVIPKSHRMELLLEPNERKLSHSKEELLFLKRGDVIVLHHNLVHSRTPNTSKTDRFYLSVLYNHSWLKQTAKLNSGVAKKILDAAMENNDHRMMRLLGQDLKLEERGNSGFLSKDEDIWKEWIKDDMSEIKATADYLTRLSVL